MQLLDYLELKGQSVSDFAGEVHARLGGAAGLNTVVTRVWRHVHGKRIPAAEDQVLYEEMTKGAVTPRDWVELAVRMKELPPDDDATEQVAASG